MADVSLPVTENAVTVGGIPVHRHPASDIAAMACRFSAPARPIFNRPASAAQLRDRDAM